MQILPAAASEGGVSVRETRLSTGWTSVFRSSPGLSLHICCLIVAMRAGLLRLTHINNLLVSLPYSFSTAISELLVEHPNYSHLEGLFGDCSRREIHAHQFQCHGLLGHSLSHVLVRLADDVAHFAGAEHCFSVGLPHGGDGGVGAAHLSFEIFVAQLFAEEISEVDLEASVGEAHVAESHLE